MGVWVCKRERDANLNILTLGEQMGAAPVGGGGDLFYLIDCCRNIYPGCSLDASLDVFMCFGCVHTRWFLGVQCRVGLMPGLVSRSEVFVEPPHHHLNTPLPAPPPTSQFKGPYEIRAAESDGGLEPKVHG